MNHDIFISYSSKNIDIATMVCQALEDSGIKCWIAPRDIPSSSEYGDLIDEAILSCKLFLFIYSYDSLNSVWCKGELNLAFCNKKIILPYCIDSTPMKGAVRVILNQYQLFYADSDNRSKFTNLVNVAAKALGKTEHKSIENQINKHATKPDSALNKKHKDQQHYTLRYLWLGIVSSVIVAIVLMVGNKSNTNSSSEVPLTILADEIVREGMEVAEVAEVIAEDAKPVKEGKYLLFEATEGMEIKESIGFTTPTPTSTDYLENIEPKNEINNISTDIPQTEYVIEHNVQQSTIKTDEKKGGDSSIANNEIWYTTNDGKIINPSGKEPFNVKITTNTYSNEVGIITFEGDVTTIRGWAFLNCKNLTSIIIPESIKTIEEDAFQGCKSLKEFKGKFAADNGRCLIKDNTIIAYAFDSGSEYTIPNEVKKIGAWTFYNCDNLKKITLPDSLTTIGFVSFADCDSLTTITIPQTVMTIRGGAFEGCRSLTNVYLMPETPPIDPGYIGGFFKKNASDRKIYVPINSVDSYKKIYSVYAEDIIGYEF